MTRDEIAQALASIGEHHTRAQRELFQLILRLQKEGLADPVPAAQPGPAPEPRETQEDLFPVASAVQQAPDPRVCTTREQALAAAKRVLRTQPGNQHQDHLLHLVDRVGQQDIDALRRAPTCPAPPAQTPTPVQGPANIEFFRDLFNAQTIAGGRGPVGRGAFGLTQYQEDVRVARQTDLRTWPSGFYTDHTNQATQFMLNQSERGWAILVEGLPRGDIRASIVHYNEEEIARFIPMAPVVLDQADREFLTGCFRQAFGLSP